MAFRFIQAGVGVKSDGLKIARNYGLEQRHDKRKTCYLIVAIARCEAPILVRGGMRTYRGAVNPDRYDRVKCMGVNFAVKTCSPRIYFGVIVGCGLNGVPLSL